MKNVLKSSAKNVLIKLRLPTGASATDAAIQKKTFGSATTALIILNKEIEDIMKKFLEESGYLIKVETIKNEAKEQKGRSLKCYWVHWLLVFGECINRYQRNKRW